MNWLTLPSEPGAICSVERQVYVQSPKAGASTSVKRVWCVGPSLRRHEIHLTSSKSDIIDWGRERYSDDNGHLTRYAELSDLFTANAYKYTLTLHD